MNPLHSIRKSSRLRKISFFMAAIFLLQMIQPTGLMALTGGPSQPEVQSFEPIGTTQLVDPFSGDFTYNIPLIDVGGYPINLSYHSGVSMDQEASWVGLGWNINPGNISRNMRGIPDDFGHGADIIKKQFNVKENITYGGKMGAGLEILGKDGLLNLGYSLGVNVNNYNGVSVEQSINAGINLKKSADSKNTSSLGLGLTSSSADGLTISPSLSFGKKINGLDKRQNSLSLGIGTALNSRAGLQQMNINASVKQEQYLGKSKKKKDKKGNKIGYKLNGASSGGANISFVPNTYTPQSTMPFKNSSWYFSGRVGGEFFGLTGTFDIAGYKSTQRLAKNSISSRAYGYLNTHQAAENQDLYALMDFNREKDIPYNKHVKNLPVANHTFDVYSVSGQGISGSYRPYRSDISTVFDAISSTKSESGNFGGELELGNMVGGGLDFNVGQVNSISGVWNNSAVTRFTAANIAASNSPDYEPAYFKQAGEFTPEANSAFFNQIGGYDAVQVPIKYGNSLFHSHTTNEFKKRDNSSVSFNTSTLTKTNRDPRNQAITYLTADEVAQFGITGYRSAYAKGHHIAEITTLKPDGMRYVFGVAAYNIVQKEVTFNASNNTKVCSEALVHYGNQDASVDNKRGTDNYFNKTEMPAFAHSYLLSSVLSPDYVDLTANGPTDDDLGSYTKFEYEKISPTGIYRWRTPYEHASLDVAIRADKNDDKGSYVYGTKEMMYLSKIETKTHIAIFHVSDRHDGYEVADERGGRGTKTMKKLDKISLYAKAEYIANGSSATPITEVHFEYDYSLCQGIHNHDGQGSGGTGKLTLKSLHMTYGSSNKGVLSPYKFHYADLDHDGTQDAAANPNYNLKGYDRWGNYKPYNGVCDITNPAVDLPPHEFPYTSQDNTTILSASNYNHDYNQTDINVAAWSMTRIDLPSGGRIKILYESDDYAYVQDRRAMQMLKVTGAGPSTTYNPPSNGTLLYTPGLFPTINQYIYVEIPNPTEMPGSQSYTHKDFRDDFLKGIVGDVMFFRFLVDVAKGNYEYVSGYAEVETGGIAQYENGYPKYGYIKLKNAKTGDWQNKNEQVNPISKAAWGYARKFLPSLAHNGQIPSSVVGFEQVLMALANAGLVKNMREFYNGANTTMRKKGYGANFKHNKSWVRLTNPNKRKMGGGLRVKKLIVADQWADMTSSSLAQSSEYGQEFSYDLEDGTSSGVASYEPMAGGEENPLRRPVYVRTQNLLAPDEEHYLEEPFGESFFPSPSVGYSRVTVKSFSPGVTNERKTGKTVHEFYTAKDFPTYTSRTNLQPLPGKNKPLGNLLKLRVKDHMTTSQGYLVELNDMNGKPKAQWVYAEGQQAPISGVEYKYETKQYNEGVATTSTNANITRYQLDNDVKVINEDGTVSTQTVGIDYDIVLDSRYSNSYGTTFSNNSNLNSFFLIIFPAFIPTVFPVKSTEETRYKSVITTKVINRYGILRETIAHDAGSQVSTKNLAWDSKTGEVLLTETVNEYDDALYNMTYPAHWTYDLMGQAYENIGATIPGVMTTAAGNILNSGMSDYLVKGDEVFIDGKRAWVWLEDGSPTYYLMNESGEPLHVSSASDMKILRSGRRNQQAMPVGNITTKRNPLDNLSNGKISFTAVDASSAIIAADAVEYSEEAQGTDFWKLEQLTTISPTTKLYVQFLNSLIQTGDFHGVQQSARKRILQAPYEAFANDYVNKLREESKLCGVIPNGSCPLNTVFFDVSHSIAAGGANSSTKYASFYCDDDGNGTGCLANDCNLTLSFDPTDPNYSNFVAHPWYDVVSFEPMTDAQYVSHFQNPFYQVINSSPNMIPILAKMNDGTTLEVHMVGLCGSLAKFFAPSYQMVCAQGVGDTVNPYINGLRGNFKPKKSYLYLTDRTQTTTNGNSNIREDGVFTSFSDFWVAPGSPGALWTMNATNWTWTAEVTRTNQVGGEVENVDPLGRYSAALFGYDGKMATAVASNTRYNQIAYDGFEDYHLPFVHQRCETAHFRFTDDENRVVDEEAHTGSYSIKLEDVVMGTDPVELSRNYVDPSITASSDQMPFQIANKDILPLFGPLQNESMTYRMSYWIKEHSPTNPLDYQAALAMAVEEASTPLALSLVSKSDVIEGWQRFEWEFMASSLSSASLALKFANGGANAVYLDDIRIYPENSSMRSFVYDPVNFRFIAELDANNFATFYEYDDQGSLIRVKKETERGIATLQESRNNSSNLNN